MNVAYAMVHNLWGLNMRENSSKEFLLAQKLYIIYPETDA